VGLGIVASRARRVTDGMMRAAAHALAEHSPAIGDPGGSLLPPLHDLRRVAVEIAMAVGLEAQRAGLAELTTSESLREAVAVTQWTPEYPQL
jgi:malate dehydrogenase (oxaloacetate-decarboxylating)